MLQGLDGVLEGGLGFGFGDGLDFRPVSRHAFEEGRHEVLFLDLSKGWRTKGRFPGLEKGIGGLGGIGASG